MEILVAIVVALSVLVNLAAVGFVIAHFRSQVLRRGSAHPMQARLIPATAPAAIRLG